MYSSAKTRGVLCAYEEMEAAVEGAMMLERFKRRVRRSTALRKSRTVNGVQDAADDEYHGTKKRARSRVDDVSARTHPLISNRGKRARPFRTTYANASTIVGACALERLRDSVVPKVPQVSMANEVPSDSNSNSNSGEYWQQSPSPEGGASVTAKGSGRTTEEDAFSFEEPPRRTRPRLWVKRSPLDD